MSDFRLALSTIFFRLLRAVLPACARRRGDQPR
jgi:hypothetical protein